jgi:hypothetical protein
MITGFPPSITATTELVVPKSIPIIFPMILSLLFLISFYSMVLKLSFLVGVRFIEPAEKTVWIKPTAILKAIFYTKKFLSFELRFFAFSF